MITPLGESLTSGDLRSLAARWIDPDTARRQHLRRVSSFEAGAILGRNGPGNYAGLLIPYICPGDDYIREYRVRRDHPEIENGKPRLKYLSPPGRGNLLYFPVGTEPAALSDVNLPLVITEGEFKAIALDRAARHGLPAGEARFVSVGLSGVWNWRGTIGKTRDADGNRIDVKGPIPDLNQIAFDDRLVLILYDADLDDNDSVAAARFMLTKELRSRAAQVCWFNWPEDRPHEVKGVDDLLATRGPDAVLALIEATFEHASGPPDLMKFHFADSGNADRLVVLHGADLRYCYAFRKWLRWDGKRWAIDDVGHALKLAKRTMVAFLHQVIEAKKDDAEKFARGSLDARRLNAALALAQPELPITPAELDRGAHLLNFTNGTVDLKTARLLPHRRSHWLTRMVHYPYRAAAMCPGWLAFLDQIMGGGPDASEGDQERARELVDYLQLALGYSITADVSEKAVFFAYGSGDNGKTTMLAIVRDLTKEYSVTIALDILTARDDSNNVASARASLMGARLAVSSETEQGQRLSPARLKRICQGSGGEIEACRKYENQITFPESHKLWVDANHKPELPATEASVWNRVHLIPFKVTIPKDEQDRGLKDRLLKDEAEGILAWLVEGAARLWYEKGLPSSKIVAAATEEWRASLDRVQDFLEERTLKAKADDKEAYILAKDLYASYRRWCEENSERPLSEPRFRGQITDMKFGKEKKHEGKAWLGLRFRPLPENG